MLTVHWLARRPACMGNIEFNLSCWCIPLGMYSSRKHVPFEMDRPGCLAAWRLRCTGGAGAKLRQPPGTDTAPATSFPKAASCPDASQRLASRASTALVPPACSSNKPPPSWSCQRKSVQSALGCIIKQTSRAGGFVKVVKIDAMGASLNSLWLAMIRSV